MSFSMSCEEKISLIHPSVIWIDPSQESAGNDPRSPPSGSQAEVQSSLTGEITGRTCLKIKQENDNAEMRVLSYVYLYIYWIICLNFVFWQNSL